MTLILTMKNGQMTLQFANARPYMAVMWWTMSQLLFGALKLTS